MAINESNLYANLNLFPLGKIHSHNGALMCEDLDILKWTSTWKRHEPVPLAWGQSLEEFLLSPKTPVHGQFKFT